MTFLQPIPKTLRFSGLYTRNSLLVGSLHQKLCCGKITFKIASSRSHRLSLLYQFTFHVHDAVSLHSLHLVIKSTIPRAQGVPYKLSMHAYVHWEAEHDSVVIVDDLQYECERAINGDRKLLFNARFATRNGVRHFVKHKNAIERDKTDISERRKSQSVRHFVWVASAGTRFFCEWVLKKVCCRWMTRPW